MTSGATPTSSSTGDAEPQAVRFSPFPRIAGRCGQSRAIPAKGLTGPGYDGHTFWDTESFILPMLTYTAPAAAGEELRWRHATMDKAKARAAELGQRGAMFPWRSINGDEQLDIGRHRRCARASADIANATARYLRAAEDEKFETECGWSCGTRLPGSAITTSTASSGSTARPDPTSTPPSSPCSPISPPGRTRATPPQISTEAPRHRRTAWGDQCRSGALGIMRGRDDHPIRRGARASAV